MVEKTKKKKHKEKQKENKSKNIWWISAVAILVAAIFCSLYLKNDTEDIIIKEDSIGSSHIAALHDDDDDFTLDESHEVLFSLFDRDKNGKIDREEFVEIAIKMKVEEDGKTETEEKEEKEEAKKEETFDENLILFAQMKPLNLTTMTTQSAKNTQFGTKNFEYPAEFNGLLSWKFAAEEKKKFPASSFSVFLPKSTESFSEVYRILQQPTVDASSDRYTPPKRTQPNEKLIHSLLQMLHENPFIYMRFSPQGGLAVVSAQSKDYLKIIFRLHCEFQLNKKPQKPFWFTPGQFTGHLIISKDGTHVRDFNLRVPNKRKLNVDMEWFVESDDDDDTHEVRVDISNTTELKDDDDDDDDSGGHDNMEVDIGYVPLMEIFQKLPSSPDFLMDFDGSFIDRRKLQDRGEDIELHFENIVWKKEIKDEHALEMLDEAFNPFKKVEYQPFDKAVMTSRETLKPLHHVLLWGALDDQSC